MTYQPSDLIMPGITDRVILALEWLNMRVETNGKGYVIGRDIQDAAAWFGTDDHDEESVCQRLYGIVLRGEAA